MTSEPGSASLKVGTITSTPFRCQQNRGMWVEWPAGPGSSLSGRLTSPARRGLPGVAARSSPKGTHGGALPPRVPRSPSLRGPWRLEGGRGGRKLRGHTRLRLQGPGVGRVKGGGHPYSGRQDRRDWLISPGRREKGKKNSIGLLVKILPCVEGWSPKRYVHLEHVNVTLFRKRVFADVINTRL